ncbi:MAG: futalosine hydrolase [Candidatus Electrothrix sp. EH2]|nr:futalosine hydrolase [Candidatus Electrothrix sp. EH2]
MVILLTAATDMEMQAFLDAGAGDRQRHIYRLVTGIGPVETTLALSDFLHKKNNINCVLNFGVAGAYPENNTSLQAGLLDICLAEQEVLADLGIQRKEKVELFKDDLPVRNRFILDAELRSAAEKILREQNIPYKQGTFLTVNCASGTYQRGKQLGCQFGGLCENMEGAAVARVCEHFSLPCLEIRCISNMVEERNKKYWRLRDACAEAGKIASTLAAALKCDMKEEA